MAGASRRSAGSIFLLIACAACIPTSNNQGNHNEGVGKCSFNLTQQQRCDRTYGNVINYVEINTIRDSSNNIIVDVNRQLPPGSQNSSKNLNRGPWTIFGLPNYKDLTVQVDTQDFRGMDRGYPYVYYATKDDELRFSHDGLEWTTKRELQLEGRSAWCRSEGWDDDEWTCALDAQSNIRDRLLTCYFSCS
ncbi:uncharacterized protein EI97DRAFT_429203 [Westerdykella ornata]|uniref:Uncharacterized protein n=1 Tax=Westerdykella ornata TaxID=318751 RepID=A0A6A6JWZ9_WESOR|nr:uncharacterized protein EI97DRAFT_429203 [Westerdykella ornata]KAF2281140.1 hypothetical protein EI97DRAFT_429203 [Westerdykella ornata]